MSTTEQPWRLLSESVLRGDYDTAPTGERDHVRRTLRDARADFITVPFIIADALHHLQPTAY